MNTFYHKTKKVYYVYGKEKITYYVYISETIYYRKPHILTK